MQRWKQVVPRWKYIRQANYSSVLSGSLNAHVDHFGQDLGGEDIPPGYFWVGISLEIEPAPDLHSPTAPFAIPYLSGNDAPDY
jgi:hypothetical protein